MSEHFTPAEIQKKLEYYCSYQERCHFEVEQKLYSLERSPDIRNQIIVKLIEGNYLNEERFATLYAQSKLHQKKWGKVRIKLELKARKISEYLINKSLNEFSEEEYHKTFETAAEKHWESRTEKNAMKKRKNFCDYMLRHGWESDLVYAKVKELEKTN